MAEPTNRPSIAALQDTVESLRAEINDLKNRPGYADVLANLRMDLEAVKEQLAAAKAKPAEPQKAPDNGKEKTAPAPPTGDTPRARFGFW